MTALVGLVLVAAAFAYIGWPLLRGAAARPPDPSAPDARRELVLRQLSELEYDYRMGKLTREDYLQQSAALTGRRV